jgi:hypothetical protein
LTRRGRQHPVERKRELHRSPARSMTLARRDTSCTEVGRSRVFPRAASARGTHREVQGRNPMTNEHGKSDRPIVPGKSPNKAGISAAEEMEGRGLAKGNLGQQNAFRTQSRVKGVPGDRSSSLGSQDAPSELAQIRQTAKSNKDAKFTALMHHIYRIDTLPVATLWRSLGSTNLKQCLLRCLPVRPT